MSDIIIPPESLEAAILAAALYVETSDDFTERGLFRAACLAMLNAWPGITDSTLTFEERTEPVIILPLTENSDDRIL